MTTRRQRLGRRGEEIATRRLRASGYRIIDRNRRVSSGEIDVVAEDGHTLVFVEVRAKGSRSAGSPEESIDARKRQRLIATAEEYLQENGLDGRDWRIDLVAVELAPNGDVMRADVIKNAVEREG